MDSQVNPPHGKSWDFHVVVDTSFLEVQSDAGFTPANNKHVLSICNDFEDGKWRYEKFQNFVWDNIAQTSLSYRERESLAGNAHSLLVQAAKKLRLSDKDINKGSELAEIVLYGLMRRHFGALPVVPKIFYKQNTQDNAKGADSVHIVVEGDDFTVWFGEAKFYNSLEDKRLLEIVKSVGHSLETKKLKKENSIITNVSDIDALVLDEGLRGRIKEALDEKNSIDALKPKIHVPILILHECSLTASSSDLSSEYLMQLREDHIDRANAYFKKQVGELAGTVYKYGEVTFHIVLFPVPSKKTAIDQFLGSVQHFKGE